jgi:hypothetical protein
LIGAGKEPFQIFNLRLIIDRDIRIGRVPREEILVIVLRSIKAARLALSRCPR